MASMLFKFIGVLLVVGVIFFGGFVVGGGFAAESAEHDVKTTVEQCLPIDDAAALQACLDADEAE